MKDNRIFLKVKIKSLAAEASIIRRETARAPKELRDALANHRRNEVRSAARNTLIAYAFIRGRRFRETEVKSETPPNWKDVARMVKQYGIRWDYLNAEPHEQYAAAKADEEKRLAAWMPENRCGPPALSTEPDTRQQVQPDAVPPDMRAHKRSPARTRGFASRLLARLPGRR